MTQTQQSQPWKAVWPPAQVEAAAIPENLSTEEMTNQRAYGSHASNTKGRIVHIVKNCEFLLIHLVENPRLTGIVEFERRCVSRVPYMGWKWVYGELDTVRPWCNSDVPLEALMIV